MQGDHHNLNRRRRRDGATFPDGGTVSGGDAGAAGPAREVTARRWWPGAPLLALVLLALPAFVLSVPRPLAAQAGLGVSAVTAFKQAVAEAAAGDRDIAAFYRENGYAPIWVGRQSDDRRRLEAFLRAVRAGRDHGLPPARYGIADLVARMRSVAGPQALGRLEVDISRAYLKFARELQTGMLEPARIAPGIDHKVPRRNRLSYLQAIASKRPSDVFRSITPHTPQYLGLMKAKLSLERTIDKGGWGPAVRARSLKPGQSGPAVVALRNRLMRMGYLKRTSTAVYDRSVEAAVRAFQADHGLEADGVADGQTLAEINVPARERLGSVLVAMERERWLNLPQGRGRRHVVVNIPEFRAAIVEDGKEIFSSIVVLGKAVPNRETPEFSDEIEMMVLNPSWYVPRSIAAKEYLPVLRSNPGGLRHLEVIDGKGNPVSRQRIDFSRYSGSSFPFTLRQPPGPQNALGLVKYLFPNKHNVYLHDTPAKSLFKRARRDFSHGCIRLHKPFEFGYTLLSWQTNDPVNFFQSRLKTGKEITVRLARPVPVHIIYRTAFVDERGRIQYRADVYGRDARVLAALRQAGLSLEPLEG